MELNSKLSAFLSEIAPSSQSPAVSPGMGLKISRKEKSLRKKNTHVQTRTHTHTEMMELQSAAGVYKSDEEGGK